MPLQGGPNLIVQQVGSSGTEVGTTTNPENVILPAARVVGPTALGVLNAELLFTIVDEGSVSIAITTSSDWNGTWVSEVTGDSGNKMLGIRNDANSSTFTAADGKWQFQQFLRDNLKVAASGYTATPS